MKTKTIKCTLQTFSPVHIGCDDVYEPTSFALDDKENILKVFDPLTLLEGMDQSELRRFSEICKKGTVESIIEIFRFLHNRPVTGESRRVALCAGFRGHYNRLISPGSKNPGKELNQFQIKRTAYIENDYRPYIPGSSVKGAIRTAYLNLLADKAPDLRPYFNRYKGNKDVHKKLEARLLKMHRFRSKKEQISKDPFRLVKVSDFMPVGEIETKVFYIVNMKKGHAHEKASGPYQIMETILPGACFSGEIRVDEPQEKQEKNAVSLVPLLDELLKSLDFFYGKEKGREDRELYNIKISPPRTPQKTGEHIIRIGQHSGAESVTIAGYRNIEIRLKNKKRIFLDHSTTLWLASEDKDPSMNLNLLPLGWSILHILTPEEEKELAEREKEYQGKKKKAMEQKDISRQEQLKKKETEAREQAKKEEEAREKERIQQELDAMPEEDRKIYEISHSMIPENRVVEIYRDIDRFQKKVELAKALKKYWIEHNKWEKKHCSKKQREKVKKIKEILGEA